MPAVAYALICAVAWGAADFVAAVLTRRVPVVVVAAGVQLSGVAGAAVLVLVVRDPLPAGDLVASAALAGAISAAGLFVFYHALSLGRATVVAPLAASGAALPVVVGLARGERPSSIVAAGLAATLVGVVVVLATAGDHDDAGRSDRRAVLWAVAAAAGFGCFVLATDARGDGSLPWFLLLARTTAATPVVAVVLARRVPRPLAWSPTTGVLAAVGLVDAIAWACSALALGAGELAVVSVLIALAPLVTVLLAAALLRERLRRVELAGVALSLSGVLLIAVG